MSDIVGNPTDFVQVLGATPEYNCMAVISHSSPSDYDACIGYNPHDLVRVTEDTMSILTGQLDRLVLYCRKCGKVIIHSLEMTTDAE